jgi:hypothetical protein
MNAFIGSAGRAISSVLEKSTIELKSRVYDAIEVFRRTFASEGRLSVTHHA